jgi:Anti-sigma-K factor rskA, C-terminal/Putative zinc-finger
LTEQPTPHDDLAAYLLGALLPAERERFERHLETCAACRSELAELREPALLGARAVPPLVMPDGLEGRTFAAIEREAAGLERAPIARRSPWRRRRPLFAAAAVVAVAALAFVGVTRFGGGAGTVELESALSSPTGRPERATVEVRKTGIGRVIRFDSDDLAILPKGDYYELWFVGPGDTRARPNRISAGTFHPDEDGRSHARFTAAVDPGKYPVVSVTAEPGDGDPRPTGPEVLRSRPAG